jgi:putative PIN family toxin of toxin-antitoxin system
MSKAVLDTSILVSAFLNPIPGGASFDLLRFAKQGAFELYLSGDILAETRVLLTSQRNRKRYSYTEEEVEFYCRMIVDLASIVTDLPEIHVVRDPNDDVILATAIAAKVGYLVSRDKDLLSLGEYEGTSIVSPEAFLHLLRTQAR